MILELLRLRLSQLIIHMLSALKSLTHPFEHLVMFHRIIKYGSLNTHFILNKYLILDLSAREECKSLEKTSLSCK